MLEFRKQGFYFFSLPLCVGKLWCVGQLAGTLPGKLLHVDRKIFVSSTRALGVLRAGPTTCGAVHVRVSTIANIQANVVELFSRRTAITVVCRLIGKTLRSIEGTVLALSILPRPHVRSDFPLGQPLQKLPVPIGSVGPHRFWLSSLPLRKTGEHVLRGHRFLTQPCCRGLHSHDYATVVIDQIVVVVTQPGRRTTLGGVGGIRIGGGDLILCMHR